MAAAPSRQISAGGMTHEAETRGIGSPFLEMRHQEIDRTGDFADDGANLCLRSERVFNKRHVEATRERAGGNMRELLLGQTLPIAPMDESQGRHPDAWVGDPVHPLTYALSVE